jgi:hypothetical protein
LASTNSFPIPSKRFLVVLISVTILASALFSIKINSVLYFGVDNDAASSNIPMLGVDQVAVNPVNQSFINSISAQGLKWNRECVCFLTPSFMSYLANAGISTLGMINYNPAPPAMAGNCSTDTLEQESTYKATIQNMLASFPTIHNWEYGNEPNGAGNYWCSISPQNYFQGLVWAYEVISATPGHTTDTIQGPTESIWTGSGSGSCYDSGTLSWFKTFWGLTDSSSGLTPAKILTWVSLHVYTQGEQWGFTLTSGPCAGETVSQMLSNGLSEYYNAEGKSKQIVISETGFPSNTGGGTASQAEWYQNMMPFYESLGYIHGVFAFLLIDSPPEYTGLFDSTLEPKPAWSIYESYLSGSSTTSSTTLSTTTSFSLTPKSTTTGESITQRTTTEETYSSLNGGTNSSNTASNGGSLIRILSVMSPSRNPPVAYAVATYEVFLIGSLGYVMARIRNERGERNEADRWRW